MRPMFIAAQFTIAKCWKPPKCPSVKEWIKKLWYIYDADHGQRDLCAVAAIDKFTQTTEILWRKRDCMATL